MKRPPLRAYLEACLALARARATLLARPSKSHFSASVGGTPASDAQIVLIHRTLTAASRRLPFRTLCYEQALAARTMLARRGLSSRLHFGTGKADGDLTAHVWLTSGERMVVGAQEAARHVELARSPEPEA